MKVLVKEQVVFEMGVFLKFFIGSKHGPVAIFVLGEDADAAQG
jgi:hypothetical protein